MQNKTTEIATIRQAVRLQEWSQLIKDQQASGLTIKQWCEENGIKPMWRLLLNFQDAQLFLMCEV